MLANDFGLLHTDAKNTMFLDIQTFLFFLIWIQPIAFNVKEITNSQPRLRKEINWKVQMQRSASRVRANPPRSAWQDVHETIRQHMCQGLRKVVLSTKQRYYYQMSADAAD